MAHKDRKKPFLVELIHPSRYDDDGYVVQWWRSWIPSNTLACLYALADDAAARHVLGGEVPIVVRAYDESNMVIPIRRIIRRIRANGGRALVCIVGVQSNQFPRAVDIARQFRRADISVVIGGFHVSGSLKMLPRMPDDLKEALELGITLFAGEAEGRFDELLAHAYNGRLQPLYNYLGDLPDLEGQPPPRLPERSIRRMAERTATFDTGRGCPFACKFCTIANIQGRESRSRAVNDVEETVRAHHAIGINRFFITDDNFARNKRWGAILDRLIELRENEGIAIEFVVQLDAMAYRIPDLVEKLRRSGCIWVFVGIESVNPENIANAGKRHNHVEEYRQMLQTWFDAGIMTQAGYIVGFPADSAESIRRDIDVLKHQLPLDFVKFACLMPLPGSVDHRDKMLAGKWMDPDMNRYTGEKAVTRHPHMSREQWEEAFWQSWPRFYSLDHIETTLRRWHACWGSTVRVATQILRDVISFRYDRVQPLEGGLFRRKVRTQRRPGLPVESPFVFYPRRLWEFIRAYVPAAIYIWQLVRLRRRIKYREFGGRIGPPQDRQRGAAGESDGCLKHDTRVDRPHAAVQPSARDKNAAAEKKAQPSQLRQDPGLEVRPQRCNVPRSFDLR